MGVQSEIATTFIALICACLFTIVQHSPSTSNDREKSSVYVDAMDSGHPIPFQRGMEYNYQYNAQISTGLVSSFASAKPGITEQRAVTRIQAIIILRFLSERQALLKLRNVRIGALNDLFPQFDHVASIELFESKEIRLEKRYLLQLPVKFVYMNGLIQRIQFHKRDESWSENIKRAVLNMIQSNFKRNNTQEQRLDTDRLASIIDVNDDAGQFRRSRGFTMSEVGFYFIPYLFMMIGFYLLFMHKFLKTVCLCGVY